MAQELLSYADGCKHLDAGISRLREILEGEAVGGISYSEYMTLYTVCYNMCTAKSPLDFAQELYEKYKQTFEEYIRDKVLPELQHKHDEYLLKEVVKRWGNQNTMVRFMAGFFQYLDRFYAPRRQLGSLHQVALLCFKKLVYEEVKGSIKDAVITLINKERDGEPIDRGMLKNVLGIFVSIGMESYENDFEAAMLDDTSAYYSRKASNWIVDDRCPDYLIKAEQCLQNEDARVTYYLHMSTRPKLIERVQQELLLKFEQQLLEKDNSGCRALLRDDKVDDLSRLYRLYNLKDRVPSCLEPIATIFRQHVTEEGTALVKQAEDGASNKRADKKDIVGAQEQVFVRSVLELHDKYLHYVATCFQNHTLFHKALKDAFETFCNKGVGNSTSAELLATFCDNLLKKGGTEKLSDEDVEETLEKVVRLLAYISDKDLFAEFYRKKLARRLLFDKSANDDHERSILTKLKQQCGGQFTSKMEGMVTDLTLAREQQSKFDDFVQEQSNKGHGGPGIDFSVTVLTTGFWPSYKSCDLTLPEEMVKCVEVFQTFYEKQTSHRKLTWIFSLGTCNVLGKFQPKNIELIVTTFQAAVLLLFNGAQRLTYNDILSQLNLTDEDLVRVMHSLSCAKYKILLKDPPNARTVNPSDVFTFNTSFTDKMRRIKVPLPPVDEKKKVIEDVDKDRRYAIDASIVRIMKSRKVLGHQQLVMECVKQLSKMFKPDFKVIKKRIEDLIAREYLERDKENPNNFRYLA